MSDAAASHPMASRGCFTPLPSQKCLREVVTRGKLRLESLGVKRFFAGFFCRIFLGKTLCVASST